MRLLKSLQTDENKTIILISHDMNEVARYADEVIVMKEGSIVSQTSQKSSLKKRKLAGGILGCQTSFSYNMTLNKTSNKVKRYCLN